MLEEGVGYNEEWQLGALLSAATKRRNYRIRNGSTESMIDPLPQASVNVYNDENAEDGLSVSLNVDVSHNAGMNSSTLATELPNNAKYSAPASAANLLVTEMMILAGEAMGKWGINCTKKNSITEASMLPNPLPLPYRSQKKPDFQTKERDKIVLDQLISSQDGNGYCATWYARRFFSPVSVSENPLPHFGMGLDCYVQWTSPIRRYSDLQVHAMVKRHLRREKINELMKNDDTIPAEINAMDIGCPVPRKKNNEWILNKFGKEDAVKYSIDFKEGVGFAMAARPLQRVSQTYWIFEYIRRLVSSSQDVAFECTVLGCIDAGRSQYAVYVHELGLEHRYLSELGTLDSGQIVWLKVASVNPRMQLMTLTLAQKDHDAAARIAARAA